MYSRPICYRGLVTEAIRIVIHPAGLTSASLFILASPPGKKLSRLNPFPAELSYLCFHLLKVVHRYRDPQLQAGENYPHLFHLTPNICKF